jgi:hypothetical protein
MSVPAFFKSFDNITAATYGDESADDFASFGFSAKGGGVRIRHLGGAVGAISFSFTGQADHGVINVGDGDLVFQGIRADRIYFKGGSGDEVIQVYAWSDL